MNIKNGGLKGVLEYHEKKLKKLDSLWVKIHNENRGFLFGTNESIEIDEKLLKIQKKVNFHQSCVFTLQDAVVIKPFDKPLEDETEDRDGYETHIDNRFGKSS